MRVDAVFRVMWLAHCPVGQDFEFAALRSAGVDQILTPKVLSSLPDFWGTTPDYSNDSALSIPREVLGKLNSVNWFESSTAADWELASRFFDVCVLSMHDWGAFKHASNCFQGLVLWRTYGAGETSHAKHLADLSAAQGERWIKRLGARFFMAPAAHHFCAKEPHYLAHRVVDFPLGISSGQAQGVWEGGAARILFACPHIGVDPAATKAHREFKAQFDEFVYSVVGNQYVEVDDKSVLGTLPRGELERNMREARLMFCSSRMPDRFDHFSLEALKIGLPIVFLEGGFLDRVGGKGLPGRCKDVVEAKRTIKRMLLGDVALIDQIRQSQQALQDALSSALLGPVWAQSIRVLQALLDAVRRGRLDRPPAANKKIAVILPIAYQGGSLRGAKLLAEAVRLGSLMAGEPHQVVFFALDDPSIYSMDDFADLHPDIRHRDFRWRALKSNEARRAMRYAGFEDWEPSAARYALIEDGIKQATDCDLWIVISDRIETPILPLRPVVHLVFDYLQRYSESAPDGRDLSFLEAAREAQRIFVTTEFTRMDALQYAGIQPRKVVRLPVLAQQFEGPEAQLEPSQRDYFIWTTNRGAHKNHRMAYEALDIYYSRLGGRLRCMVTGVGTDALTGVGDMASRQVACCGNLPDGDYQGLLREAAFLWHPGRIDNGNLSVVEAASVGVPSLSSDYPAMREFDRQFHLGLTWTNAADPEAMAQALKEMEVHGAEKRAVLPSPATLESQHVQALAAEYWKAIRECL